MKFLTICHSDYYHSHTPIIKGEEYYAVPKANGYHIYTKDDNWISVFGSTFHTYFYTEDQVDKIRELKLNLILDESSL